MRSNRKELGDQAEELALDYLKKRGYECVVKNYSNKLGEIDIIAKHEGSLCFVEVRSLSSNDFTHPFETVDFFKQKRITKAAHWYIAEHDLFDMPARFDVVAVSFSNTAPTIELVENAFESYL